MPYVVAASPCWTCAQVAGGCRTAGKCCSREVWSECKISPERKQRCFTRSQCSLRHIGNVQHSFNLSVQWSSKLLIAGTFKSNKLLLWFALFQTVFMDSYGACSTFIFLFPWWNLVQEKLLRKMVASICQVTFPLLKNILLHNRLHGETEGLGLVFHPILPSKNK